MHYASPILPNMFYVWILACIIFFPPPNTVWTNRLWCQTEFQLQRARTVHLNQ